MAKNKQIQNSAFIVHCSAVLLFGLQKHVSTLTTKLCGRNPNGLRSSFFHSNGFSFILINI